LAEIIGDDFGNDFRRSADGMAPDGRIAPRVESSSNRPHVDRGGGAVMEVRGSVTDRPWGLTLGAIASRGHTGQLTIDSDGKRYCIAFDRGAVVAAVSPAAADAIARVALTSHFITSTQVGEITRRLGASPERDEVDVLSEVIRFLPEQAMKLRHRLVAQRAARTFSLEHGDFVLDDRIALPVVPGVTVDHRHVIYVGVRNLSEQRLLDDLRQLGSYFVLKPEAVDDLPRFGFEPGAHPVLEALKLGTSLPELEASHRELDPRLAQAIIYALVSCTACTIPQRTVTAAPARTLSAAARTLPPRNVTARATTRPGRPGPDPGPAPAAHEPSEPPAPPAGPGPRPISGTQPPLATRTATFQNAGSGTGSGTRPISPPFPERPLSPTAYSSTAAQDAGTNTPAATRPRTLSDSRTPRPGTPTPAPALAATLPPRSTAPGPAAIQTPPPGRAAVPPPSPSPPAVARTDTDEAARFGDIPTPSPLPGAAKAPGAAVFGDRHPPRATSGTAPSPARPAVPRAPTPSDSELRGFADQRTPSGFGDQRTPHDQRTPTDPAASRAPTGSPVASRVSTASAAAAEEAFKRGELAMKRDQPGEAILEFKAACDLNPQEVDYTGMLVWAKFCAAGDKAAIGADTRKALERVVYKSNKPERVRFYLGRVERMLGRDKEALRHFQEVLDLKPNHAEAASEVRAIEARLAAASRPGLFGRKR
jgi:hypothetical protein